MTPADARHLVRRTGFGAPHARVAPLVGLTAAEAVRRLLDEASAAPTLPDPAWYATPQTDISALAAEREAWARRMLQHPVRERLVLFWHNHFATEVRDYFHAASAWRYVELMHRHALGNVRTLVHAMGLNPAMLRYLNGNINTRVAPNQNYARELYELFSLGPTARDGSANYTEADIAETARALTGYRIRGTGSTFNGQTMLGVEVYLDTSRFDAGQKTIFGQAGAWGYDDVVRLLFEQKSRRVAQFIARKLLAFYVSAVPDAAVENGLADLLIAHGFELRPALETLLASEHFFDAGFRGALIKSPYDLYLGAIAELGCTAFSGRYLRARTDERDMALLNPPNVAGWPGLNPPNSSGLPGFTAWYASDDFGPVWTVLGVLVDQQNANTTYEPLQLLALASDPSDPFHVAVDLATAFLPVPLAYASVLPNDAPYEGVSTYVPPDFVRNGPRIYGDLAKMLLGPMPPYEWFSASDAERRTRLRAFLKALYTTVPEALVF